jgi:hypothetical protein
MSGTTPAAALAAAKPRPVTPLPASGKIIKDFTLAAVEGDAAAPRSKIEVLDFFWAPLNFYVSVTVPNELHSKPDYVSVQVCPMRDQAMFFFWNIPGPKADRAAAGGMRRVFGLISCQYNSFEAFEARLVVGGKMVSIAKFERRFGSDRLIGSVTLEHKVERAVPLLITGTQKSGTTWLETIVDTRPDVLVLHEGNTLNTVDHRAARASFEERMGEFQRRAFIRWRPAYPNAEEMAMFTQISVARNLFDLLGSTFGFRTIVDRTPSTSEAYHFLVKFWRECRYVHIIRHPLDVFISRLFHEAALGRGKTPDASRLDQATLTWLVDRIEKLGSGDAQPGDLLDDEILQSGTFDVLFMQWLVDQKKLLEVLPFARDRFLVVRYEDLFSDFEAQVKRVFEFIGMHDISAEELDYVHRATSFDAMSGGRKSGEEDRKSFFRSGQVGDYKLYLSETQSTWLWGRVATVAREFGYDMP